MKTLIELYDERPIENVLATEVFHPDRTVFLCRPEDANNQRAVSTVKNYFKHCGIHSEIEFRETSMFDSEEIAKEIESVIKRYPESMLDITGGTDAALFASGIVCSRNPIPVFTYSRRKNAFFPIYHSELTGSYPCKIHHTVEDCFKMAGGALETGRFDNRELSRYASYFEPFFNTYLSYRSEWIRTVNYLQKASSSEPGTVPSLRVDAPRLVKGPNSRMVEASEPVMRRLEKIGFIQDLFFEKDRVSFSFLDHNVRKWLRDVGAVLELYIYKLCTESALFNDICTSAVVSWEADNRKDSVKNEIDVMAMDGIIPVFISCKTCRVETEAINELAILRDRFGGKGAKAIIATTQKCGAQARHRASDLGIDVIDIEDIRKHMALERIRETVKNDN